MSDEEEPLRFIVPTELPPHGIGFVIDGVVEQSIHVHDEFGAVLLSEPIIVHTTGVNIIPGRTKYDPETGLFTQPDGTTEAAEEFELKHH